MRRLTITLRICAYAALTGLLFAGSCSASSRRKSRPEARDRRLGRPSRACSRRIEPAYGASGADEAVVRAPQPRQRGPPGRRAPGRRPASHERERLRPSGERSRLQRRGRENAAGSAPFLENLEAGALRVTALISDGDFRGFSPSLSTRRSPISDRPSGVLWSPALAARALVGSLLRLAVDRRVGGVPVSAMRDLGGTRSASVCRSPTRVGRSAGGPPSSANPVASGGGNAASRLSRRPRASRIGWSRTVSR
jgi:hypothetical protein